MASNLRSKPITGHVTDGAGNIIRNSNVTIVARTTNGSIPISNSVITNDDGFFTSEPLPSGYYNIFDSGIMISSMYHDANTVSIPVFNFANKTSDFRDFIENGNPNDYKIYFQIENNDINVARYGNTYPIYDININNSKDEWLSDFANFHNLSSESRITVTRFDIEYYSPITESTKSYKRVRWAGVPAIRFTKESPLLIPLDYYSIVPNMPKYIDASQNLVVENPTTDSCDISGADLANTTEGDIIEVRYDNSTGSHVWYGINVLESGGVVTLKSWNSSINMDDVPDDSVTVTQLRFYDGMFTELQTLTSTTNEKITVVENVFAQDVLGELYNY